MEAKQLTPSECSSKCDPLPHLLSFNARPSPSKSFSISSPGIGTRMRPFQKQHIAKLPITIFSNLQKILHNFCDQKF